MKNANVNRRSFLKAVGLSYLAQLSFVNPARASETSRRRPNVIFIITDDQKLDSFGFIRKKALTPNIDRLASEGVYFSRGYASSSVCTPSRYTCMTGRYASRSQVGKFTRGISGEGQTWVHWNADMAYGETNVAKTLKKAGYATGIVGKLHGFELPGHSKETNRKSNPNDPEVARILRANQQVFAVGLKKHGFDFAERLNRGNLASVKTLPESLRQHNPEWVVEGALNFIEQNKDRPFYLYFATTLLHGPPPLESLKSDPRITEAGFLDEPPRVQPSRKSVLERVKAAGIDDTLAPATWLDDSIGAIIGKLDQLNLREDTLIIYFNDHGVEGGKGSLYEGGIATPIIFNWPGRIKPRSSGELVSNIDFVPTILSACGVRRPGAMHTDGLDLMPVLTGQTDRTRDSLYCEIGHTRAVVTKRWKYLAFRVPPSRQQSKAERVLAMAEYYAKNPAKKSKTMDPDARITHIHRVPGGDGTEQSSALKHYAKNYFDTDQLYNLENDPRERTNLANDPKYRKVLQKLKAELKTHLALLPGTFAEFKKADNTH
ncbi:MAG: sulfatase family protein [Planctomycetota bacterium]|jgi:arylsulfatase A-like enzyme